MKSHFENVPFDELSPALKDIRIFYQTGSQPGYEINAASPTMADKVVPAPRPSAALTLARAAYQTRLKARQRHEMAAAALSRAVAKSRIADAAQEIRKQYAAGLLPD